ncbi:palmitoyltransferase ZDHHC20-B isoform X2 [Parasteatoda tepidariorum]|uniref:palmitoyltransferase ZDHHC20-B isoform X2 n=1 Tax=Parasteatoda tepidariorum TaxID=114398 RepID=UPI00077F9759
MPPSFYKSMGSKCSLCFRLFKWFPVLFICTIVAWSYYAYVVQLCFFAVESVIERIFYLIVYHAVFAMFIWAYWQTIFTDIGLVPRQFKLSPADAEQLERDQSEDNQRRLLESFARDLPVACRTMNGSIRYCEKCHNIKPDRAHHCSVCGVCVLKMDHHCPWVNNCVSFTNYKFFILFLGYALLYCLFIAASSLQYFIQFWTNNLEGPGRFHILFIFFVSVMFAVSLISLFCYHCYLVSVNRSTLESFRHPIFRTGPEKDGFSLGRRANFTEIFGEEKSKWFLPVHSSLGNGVSFPTRAQVGSSYNSMGNTNPASQGDGVSFPQKTVDEVSSSLLDNRTYIEDESELSQVVSGKLYESEQSLCL